MYDIEQNDNHLYGNQQNDMQHNDIENDFQHKCSQKNDDEQNNVIGIILTLIPK